MTINLFFVTIIIKRRKYSEEKIKNDQRVKEIMEEVKDRQFKMYRGF